MREQEANERRFVFVQPRAEFEAQRPPQNPELSDRDRSMMTRFRPPQEPTKSAAVLERQHAERIDQPGTPEPPQPAERPDR